jgi:hypothetical protein
MELYGLWAAAPVNKLIEENRFKCVSEASFIASIITVLFWCQDPAERDHVGHKCT